MMNDQVLGKEQMDQEVKELVIKEGLINGDMHNDSRSSQDTEESQRARMITVEEYSEEEIEEDMNAIDWDFAYSEVL